MDTPQQSGDENKLIAERRAKLNALRELGPAFPNDFRRTALAGELQRDYEQHHKAALEERDAQSLRCSCIRFSKASVSWFTARAEFELEYEALQGAVNNMCSKYICKTQSFDAFGSICNNFE